jgi:hypothetical protein
LIRRPTAATAGALLALAVAMPASGQEAQGGGGWNQGILMGAHVGVDHQAVFEAIVIGGQAHFMLDPWGRVTFLPNGEFEFRQGVRDWQANADLAVMPTRGVYVGGGIAFRNTQYGEEQIRETRRGHSLFLGLRTPPAPRRIGTQVELRWSFVSSVRPRTLTVGFNFPMLLIR